MEVFKNKVILEILSKYKSIWALKHFLMLGGWDSETYMPEGGLNARGEAMAKLASMVQSAMLDDKFKELVKKAKAEKDLTEQESAVVRSLSRDIEMYEKLPAEFIEELAITTNKSQAVWREAKKNNDFESFAPSLEKIVDLTIKQADYLGYESHPYDALIDQYEQGWTTKDVEEYFGKIKAPLVNLVKRIKESDQYFAKSEYDTAGYKKEKLKEFNQLVLETLHADKSKIRLDESAHPFSQGISLGDARITTRYLGESWGGSVTGTIHEFGHALYEVQITPELEGSPIGFAVSLGIHESQSRFWENMVGRSSEFIFQMESKVPGLSDKIKAIYDQSGHDGIYKYLNKVTPGLIRVEADEVTYHSHVMLRFEIEKGLVEKSIKVTDLPEIWNSKMEEYLGIRPDSNKTGVLQDIHWSMGSIGYFPTYSFGTALSAQVRFYLEQDLGSLESLIENKEYTKIQEWLRNRIHKYGSTYTMKELLKKEFNAELDPTYLINYLEKKYSKIYMLS